MLGMNDAQAPNPPLCNINTSEMKLSWEGNATTLHSNSIYLVKTLSSPPFLGSPATRQFYDLC